MICCYFEPIYLLKFLFVCLLIQELVLYKNCSFSYLLNFCKHFNILVMLADTQRQNANVNQYKIPLFNHKLRIYVWMHNICCYINMKYHYSNTDGHFVANSS